jgi:hypothetical protein
MKPIWKSITKAFLMAMLTLASVVLLMPTPDVKAQAPSESQGSKRCRRCKNSLSLQDEKQRA